MPEPKSEASSTFAFCSAVSMVMPYPTAATYLSVDTTEYGLVVQEEDAHETNMATKTDAKAIFLNNFTE